MPWEAWETALAPERREGIGEIEGAEKKNEKKNVGADVEHKKRQRTELFCSLAFSLSREMADERARAAQQQQNPSTSGGALGSLAGVTR